MRSRLHLYQQGVEDAFSSWIAALRRAYPALEEFTAPHEFIAEMEKHIGRQGDAGDPNDGRGARCLDARAAE
jgi:hypothetical protein